MDSRMQDAGEAGGSPLAVSTAEDARKGGGLQFYQGMFDFAIEGMFQSTPEGRFLLVNQALARIFGYDFPEELIRAARDLNDFYVEPGRRNLFCREAIERGSVAAFESEVRRLDGARIWISENARAVYGPGGEPIRLEGMVREITERKRTERALRDSRRFVARVADTSPGILYVFDLEERRFVYANHQVAKMLGYSAEEMIAMAGGFVERFTHPDDAELRAERDRRIASAADGEVFAWQHRIKDARGNWRWLECRDTVFTRNDYGGARQIIGIAQDITERLENLAALENSREQLRALSARLQEMLEKERVEIAREIHDALGGGLTALRIGLANLENRCLKSDSPDLEEMVVERIGRLSRQVDELIGQVRMVSTKLRPPVLDELGLTAAIDWQTREFQERCAVECELRCDVRLEVADAGLATAIFRIYQEILTNVARHSSATSVRTRLWRDGKSICLEVSDNGRGITEGEQSKSLGLLGMRERAHLFGGTVRIEGRAGRGTVVFLSVPCVGSGWRALE